jgi:hypothetical protein
MKIRVIATYSMRLAFLIAVGSVALGILRTREFIGDFCRLRNATN